MQILIEAIKGYSEKVHSREWDRDGKQGVSYSQEMYIHNGGAFPVKFTMPLSSPDDALSIGKYVLTPACLKIGQYDKLEINNFDLAKSLQKI